MISIWDYQNEKMDKRIKDMYLINYKNGVIRELDGTYIGKFVFYPLTMESKFILRKTKVKATNL